MKGQATIVSPENPVYVFYVVTLAPRSYDESFVCMKDYTWLKADVGIE